MPKSLPVDFSRGSHSSRLGPRGVLHKEDGVALVLRERMACEGRTGQASVLGVWPPARQGAGRCSVSHF